MPLLYIGLGIFLIFLVVTGKLQQVLAQVFQATPPSVKAG